MVEHDVITQADDVHGFVQVLGFDAVVKSLLSLPGHEDIRSRRLAQRLDLMDDCFQTVADGAENLPQLFRLVHPPTEVLRVDFSGSLPNKRDRDVPDLNNLPVFYMGIRYRRNYRLGVHRPQCVHPDCNLIHYCYSISSG